MASSGKKYLAVACPDFLATFEPTDNLTQFMAFRIGYGVIGMGCLVGVGFLIAKALQK